MPTIHLHTEIAAPVETVFMLARSIDLHVASMAHAAERAVAGRTAGLIELGESVTWEGRYLGVRQRLKVQITAMDAPHSFTDELVEGAFKSFRHDHRFLPTPRGTLMIDAFHYTSPLGWLGRFFNFLILNRYVRKMLRVRNPALCAQAEAMARR
jgi:ligand-binding SRPBCC domain-containing protein